MADKRKAGTGQSKRPTVRRPKKTGGTAGRIAVRRDTAAYRRAAMDEHSVQVRDQIDAALAEGRRMREEIEQRIEQLLQEEDPGNANASIITRLTAAARLHPVKPLSVESHKGASGASRSRSSK
ncbi:hypothetical protein [Archangium sp.]|uniref:hypothetical protein n=1 Tax=Archangium sp. TaxID=1872627 RepID=UPI002EDAF385